MTVRRPVVLNKNNNTYAYAHSWLSHDSNRNQATFEPISYMFLANLLINIAFFNW